MAKQKDSTRLFKAIVLTALLAGTLDITCAMINYLLHGNSEPVKVLVYIASGAFGEAAFDPKAYVRMAAMGLIFHYVIALGWTALFFLTYTRLKTLSKNRYILGAVYGVFVWLIMNLLIVPLSNAPRGPFDLLPALIAIGILIIAIGLPISLMAYRYFNK